MKTKYTPVTFFLGPGGVGKSTLSALSAVKKALEGQKVLIATFDPSPRLKDILAKKGGFQNDVLNKNLEVVVLNSREIFESLLSSVDTKTSESIQSNKLFKHLIERIQGVQEFSSLYFLNQHVSHQNYDLIIIDTPPLQNSLDFFSSPQKLKDLFSSTIVKLFIGDFNKNWFERIFKKTRDLAFATLKKLTGIDFFEQLISFMKALEKLQPVILKTLDESQNILFAPSSTYSFVTSFEEQNLLNAEKQMNLISSKDIKFSDLYINKFEDFMESDILALISAAKFNEKNELLKYLNYKKDKYEQQLNSVKNMAKQTKYKVHTLDKFTSYDMNENDLITKSREIHEYRS